MATTWAAARDASPTTAKVVVLGDSLSCSPSPYSAWPNSWVGRVAWEWPTVTNLARSGAMPQDLLPGADTIVRSSWYADWGAGVMAQVGQLQADVVVVWLGTVNYGSIGQHPNDFMAHERALCDSIRTRSPSSTILLVHGPGFVASHGQKWIWVDYGTRTDEYVRSQPNMGYCDLARDLPWSDSDTSGAFVSDHVHLNNAGQVMAAVGIIGRLRWL